MGVSISHKLGQTTDRVKGTLDNAQKIAELYKKEQANKTGISLEIRRESDNALLIDIGQCETLSFQFMEVEKINKEKEAQGYSYEYAVLTDDGKHPLEEGYRVDEFPQNRRSYCASFCKTQFSRSLAEHRMVAEIIRTVAGRCFYAEVSDEADYYHTGNIDDAGEAIAENGAMIASMSGMLGGMGYTVVKGGNTTIKPRRKRAE